MTWPRTCRRKKAVFGRSGLEAATAQGDFFTIHNRRYAVLAPLLLLISGCPTASTLAKAPTISAPDQHKASISFTDVTHEAGLRFQHTNGAAGQFYYPETFGSGAAFIDYDRDG